MKEMIRTRYRVKKKRKVIENKNSPFINKNTNSPKLKWEVVLYKHYKTPACYC